MLKPTRSRALAARKHWLDVPAGPALPVKLLSEKDWIELQQFLETLDYSDLLELGSRVNNLWMQRALDTAADTSAMDSESICMQVASK